MAAFIIGKSMKDRRQTKAIEDLFDDADKNRNGRISVKEYVNIFNEHGIDVSEDEIARINQLANEDGEVTKDEFLIYAKNSEFFRSQMDKTDIDSVVSKREAMARAERAFKLFDKDNDGFITKDEFQRISKKLNKEQIEAVFAKFDKDGDGVLSFEEFKKMLHKN